MQERIGKIPVPFIPVYFTKLSEGEATICHCWGIRLPRYERQNFYFEGLLLALHAVLFQIVFCFAFLRIYMTDSWPLILD